MRGLLVFVFAFLVVYVSARPDNKYTTKYDSVDLNEIIGNKRLLKNYVHCLLGKGNCTPDGAELKSKFLNKTLVSIFLNKVGMPLGLVFTHISGCFGRLREDF